MQKENISIYANLSTIQFIFFYPAILFESQE